MLNVLVVMGRTGLRHTPASYIQDHVSQHDRVLPSLSKGASERNSGSVPQTPTRERQLKASFLLVDTCTNWKSETGEEI